MDDSMKTTFYLDEVSSKAVKDLPRKMSASKLLRWMLKLIHTNDKEWKLLIKHDPEIKEVQDWIRPMLRKALGLKDVEDEIDK
jgi:hypothetical protein